MNNYERSVTISASDYDDGIVLYAEISEFSQLRITGCYRYLDGEIIQTTQKLSQLTLSEESAENWISLLVTFRDGSSVSDNFYYSVLPVIYMESVTGYDEVTSEEDTEISLKITDTSYSSEELYEGEAQIHLRGNSTALFQKHPFKLELDDETALLGMSENRHWVLLANASDSTLIRNRIAFEISSELGANVTVDSRQVTLIYNGEYEGVYQLCEQVRVDENRVPVYDWDEIAEDAAETMARDIILSGTESTLVADTVRELLETDLKANLSWLDTGEFESESLKTVNEAYGTSYPTVFCMKDYVDYESLPEAVGGVLLEIDFRSGKGELTTNYREPFTFVTPSGGATFESLANAISTQLQVIEYALHDTDFVYESDTGYYLNVSEGSSDPSNDYERTGTSYTVSEFSAVEYDGTHYSELIDMDSLVNNFLLSEISCNWDAMKASTYFYKDIDGLYYLEPAWDYDYAFSNSIYYEDTWFIGEWITVSDYRNNEEYFQTVGWDTCLIRDPYFLALAYEKYWEVRDTLIEGLVADGGTVDLYADEIRIAAHKNDERWGGSVGTYEGQTFDDGISQPKEFLNIRIEWLDEQFESVEALRESLGGYVPSDEVSVEGTTDGDDGVTTVRVSTTNEKAAAVSLQVNGTAFYVSELADGTAEFVIAGDDLSEEGGINTAQARLIDDEGDYIRNTEGSVYGVYKNAVSNYVCFYVQ